MMGAVLTTDFERSLQFKQDGLTEEYLSGLDAETPHLSLGHLYHLPWTTSSHCRSKQVIGQHHHRSSKGDDYLLHVQ